MSTSKGADLTQSQAESAFFNMRDTYDKDVYENTAGNWVKIVGMLAIFYFWNGLHWWANFSLGITDSGGSTLYNLCAFGSAILVISGMLFFGSQVNRLKLMHEFYTEKISEEKQRQSEIMERENAKNAKAAKEIGTIN